MHNFTTIFSFEFLRTIKRPAFWISVLSVPVIMGVVIGLNYLSSVSGQSVREEQAQSQFSLAILDESGYITDEQLAAQQAERVNDKAAAIQRVQDGTLDAFFYYPSDPVEQPTEVYHKDEGLFENFKFSGIAQSLLTAGAEQRIGSSETLELIKGDSVSVTPISYRDGEVVNSFEELVIPGAFIAVFLFVMLFLSGQMLTSTTEEKENRVIEMILTTVKPRALIVGKVVAILALGAVQAVVLLSPLIIGFIFFRDVITLPAIDLNNVFDIDPWRVVLAAAYTVASLLFFTGLLVAISAAVPTAKDANNFLGFAILGIFLPAYALVAIVSDPSQLIVQIFTYFPLTAPTTLLVRNAVGNLSAPEAIIGLVVLTIAGIVAIAIASRIFRYGTLQYSRMLSLKEIFKPKQ